MRAIIKSMISFTINGNHQNENGNPLPKARKTFRQQWTDGAERYHQYLDYVRGAFLDEFEKPKHRDLRKKFLSISGRKPLDTGDRKCKMRIFIEWGTNAHGDPENIFGAIADAIFENDKFLAGEFDFEQKPTGKGKVRCELEIYE